MTIEITPDVRRVLECRSKLDKIAIPIDCKIAPTPLLPIVTRLVEAGLMVWVDRCSLDHVVAIFPDGDQFHPNVDIYQLTTEGIKLCNANGITSR
jgi:hypothetical protein